MSYYLHPGLPQPDPAADGLDRPFWEGLAREELLLQRCSGCGRFQWGPEWICHRCHSDRLTYVRVDPQGVIYSYERVWHPVHPVLREQGPYLIVLVELPHADNVRVVGNLLGDPRKEIGPGREVVGVFEHHLDAEPAFSLLHWRVNDTDF